MDKLFRKPKTVSTTSGKEPNTTEWVRQLRERLETAMVGLGRSFSEEKWTKDLQKCFESFSNFQEVFDWLLSQYTTNSKLRAMVQSPAAMYRKWVQIEWMYQNATAKYQIPKDSQVDEEQLKELVTYIRRHFPNLICSDEELRYAAWAYLNTLCKVCDRIAAISKTYQSQSLMVRKIIPGVLQIIDEGHRRIFARYVESLLDWPEWNGNIAATTIAKQRLNNLILSAIVPTPLGAEWFGLCKEVIAAGVRFLEDT